MYIFNPEHDLCLANGDPHFVPPESALAFGRDCAGLTRFMKGLDPEADTPQGGGGLRKIVPWGWDFVLRKRLSREGIPAALLPTDGQIEAIEELSDRRVALEGHRYLMEYCPGAISDHLTPSDYRIAAASPEEVEGFLRTFHNVVLKAPISGSGKGIRWVSEALSHSDAGWCRNLIAKHGCVVVERRLSPVKEFAMLFHCSGRDGVRFCGYSLFYTENGAYRGNILASDRLIEERLGELVPLESLHQVREHLEAFLRERVCGRYEGFVGVDQFCSTEMGFHPVVEINLRMTMGLLARNIYDRFSDEFSLGDGTHRFEILREKGPAGGKYSYEIFRI